MKISIEQLYAIQDRLAMRGHKTIPFQDLSEAIESALADVPEPGPLPFDSALESLARGLQKQAALARAAEAKLAEVREEVMEWQGDVDSRWYARTVLAILDGGSE